MASVNSHILDWIGIIKDDIAHAELQKQNFSVTTLPSFFDCGMSDEEAKIYIYYRLIKYFSSTKSDKKYEVRIQSGKSDKFIVKWDVLATPRRMDKMRQYVQEHMI